MATLAKTLKDTDGNTILPKTRSELVYRPDNTNIETALVGLENLTTSSNIIYNCTHSKSGTAHAITGLPTNITTGYATIRFMATADFVSGDTMTINGVTYTPRLTNMEVQTDDAFKINAIVSADIDIAAHNCFFRSGPMEGATAAAAKLMYNYTGSSSGTTPGTRLAADDPSWNVDLLSSGNFTLVEPETAKVDITLENGDPNSTKTVTKEITAGETIPVTISNGGKTTGFNEEINGGTEPAKISIRSVV